MKNWMLAFALTLAFSLVSVAQTSSNPSPADSQSGAAATSNTGSTSSGAMGSSDQSSTSSGKKAKSEVGCLEQGSTPGTYMLKDAKHPNGIAVSYSGSEDLSKHVGHKVKVSGTMSGDSLNATNVKHISETCSVGGSASSGKHSHGSTDTSTSGASSSPSSTGTGTTNPK